MTWEEKFAALGALVRDITGADLKMRAPGDWYVSVGCTEIAEDGLLVSPTQTGAKTPTEAVLLAWDCWSTAEAIRIDATHRVRWNGYMWAALP